MSEQAVEFINNFKHFVFNPIIGFMFAVAAVVFIYGIAEFILGADNEDKKSAGKQHMIWGILGMFVMLSAYGIINLLSGFWWDVHYSL